jgi:hypothetical protein
MQKLHDQTTHYPTRTTANRRYLTALRPLALILVLLTAVAVALAPMAFPPAATTAPTAPSEFSATRALSDLVAITAAPRVMSSAEIAVARDYLAAEFRALGLETEITSSTILRQAGEQGYFAVAESTILVARLPGSDSTGAILVGGHLDSVHTTTAASDCGGCSVGVLEVARALVAGEPLRNDIIFLVEDGEETTRAGALTFVQEHPWADDVRVAFNQEAMGVEGGSQLYVTGPQNGWLMQEALRVMPSPVAYSFVNDLVWATGTGGSDLDQFLMVAPVGLGLVYVGNVAAYHSQADSVANLDLHTYQQQGSNLLALTRHFGNLPLPATLTAPDLVYFNLFGHTVLSYRAEIGIALALLLLIGYLALLVVGLRRGTLRLGALLLGAFLALVMVIVATALAGGIWQALRLLDPRLQVFLIGVTYDRGAYTLAFSALAVAVALGGFLLVRRMNWRDLGVGVLLWWVILGVWSAFSAPGSSPIFTIPALLLLLPLGMTLFDPAGRLPRWSLDVAWAVAGVGALLLITPVIQFLGIFSGRAEVLMQLPVIGIFPAPLAALTALVLLPLWAHFFVGRRWILPALAAGVALVILVGVALSADFNTARPRPNTVVYRMDKNQAAWLTFGDALAQGRAALLDEWTNQFFTDEATETVINPWGAYHVTANYPALQADAPRADLPLPEITVLTDERDADGLRHIRATFASPTGAIMHNLHVQTAGEIHAATLVGRPLDEITADQAHHDLWIDLFGFGEGVVELELRVQGEGEVLLWIEDRLYSLPELAGIEITPRPAWMMPSPSFVSDATLLRSSLTLP